MNKMCRSLYSKYIFLLAYTLLKLGYFKGSGKVTFFLSRFVPFQKILIRHPFGFFWRVSNRETFSTFISSCEPFTSKILVKLLPSADSFIVIGANLGWYPLLAKCVNPAIQVNAFECNSEIFNGLRDNINANNFEDVNLYKTAISSYECHRKLFMPPNGNNGMSTLNLREGEIQNSEFIEEVECARLDSMNIDYGQISSELVMLIDVEGHEIDVLLGALNMISRYKPLIILEVNPSMLKGAGKSFLELKLLMESLGYFGFWLDEREKIVGIHGNEPPHIQQFGSDHGANYLFTSNLEIISTIG